MDLTSVLRDIYNCEIDVTISSDWDGGFNVMIGNERNGYQSKHTFFVEELDQIAPWLDAECRKLYPDEYPHRARTLAAAGRFLD